MAKQGEISKRIKEIEDFTKTMCIPYSSKKPFYREKVFDFLECNIN